MYTLHFFTTFLLAVLAIFVQGAPQGVENEYHRRDAATSTSSTSALPEITGASNSTLLNSTLLGNSTGISNTTQTVTLQIALVEKTTTVQSTQTIFTTTYTDPDKQTATSTLPPKPTLF